MVQIKCGFLGLSNNLPYLSGILITACAVSQNKKDLFTLDTRFTCSRSTHKTKREEYKLGLLRSNAANPTQGIKETIVYGSRPIRKIFIKN